LALEDRIHARQAVPRARRELLAELSDAVVAGVAVEEQLADVGFQLLHRARDRLWRNAQAGGGFLEVARLGGGAEDAQHFEAVENRVLLTRRKGDGRLF